MSFTPNIALETPAHLSDSGTWDTPMNNNFTELDSIFGSVTSLTLSSLGTTLTTTQCAVAVFRFGGTLTSNVTITLTSTIKAWVVENTTLGNFNVTISGGSGNVVCAAPGSSQVYWDGTNVNFLNLGQVGGYLDLATTVTPTWITSCTIPPYLLCDGSGFSSSTYPVLNKILGGATLPDFRGRSRFYADGGTNRITAAASGINGTTLFAAGGLQNLTIATANMPSHNHALTDPGHVHSIAQTADAQAAGSVPRLGGLGATQTNSTTTGITLAAVGGSQAATTLPPACIGGITLIRAY